MYTLFIISISIAVLESFIGRGDTIWTRDIWFPKPELYRTELRPEISRLDGLTDFSTSIKSLTFLRTQIGFTSFICRSGVYSWLLPNLGGRSWIWTNESHREAGLQPAAITAMRPAHINGFPGIFVEAHNRKELLNLYHPFAEGAQILDRFNILLRTCRI